MNNQRDARDWVVMALVSLGGLAATVFLFCYPSSVNFATWSGFEGTLFGVYHWLTISDDKRVDSGNVTSVLPAEGLTSQIDRDWLRGDTYAGATETHTD